MKGIIRILAGAAIVAALGVPASPALSESLVPDAAKRYRGAPAPIAGAGLPVLAVGLAVYWVLRRRRKPN